MRKRIRSRKLRRRSSYTRASKKQSGRIRRRGCLRPGRPGHRWKHSSVRHSRRLALQSRKKRAGTAALRSSLASSHRWETVGRTAAVLSVSENHPLLHSVLDELQKLSLNEIILVLRCKDDALSAQLLSHSSSPVIVCEELENDNQARAAGARISSSDIILFPAADRVIPADHFVQLILMIASGADLALQDRNQSAFHHPFHIRNEDTVIREFVRMALGRKNVEAHTLSVLPYALSRTAVERIGYDRLAEPFHALTDAIRLGMNIQSLASTGPSQISEEKQEEPRFNGLLARLRAAMDLRGPRLRFQDSVRLRRYTREES